jgi:hypothetical protein
VELQAGLKVLPAHVLLLKLPLVMLDHALLPQRKYFLHLNERRMFE